MQMDKGIAIFYTSGRFIGVQVIDNMYTSGICRWAQGIAAFLYTLGTCRILHYFLTSCNMIWLPNTALYFANQLQGETATALFSTTRYGKWYGTQILNYFLPLSYMVRGPNTELFYTTFLHGKRPRY
jgi:hypothetical protein